MKSNHQFILFIILSFLTFSTLKAQIVINEIDVSPTSNDGSIIGYSSSAGGSGQGEWIELYNPTCNPIDISGYIISTFNSTDGDGMSFIVPSGKIVPAKGFAVIRGGNKSAPAAGVIDIKADDVTASKYCIDNPNPSTGEPRMWFSNAGSWIGLYSKTGAVVDMIKWGTPLVASDLSGNPCIPSSSTLPGSTTLASFTSYGLGGSITSSATAGKTFVRIPDGGTWSQTAVNETTSYGSRNQALPTASISYTGSPWCTSAGTKSVTLTGTGTYTGGTYSSTTGLTIDASTGLITVSSSTPGTYTVTYTLTGLTCPDYAVTTSVTIDNISATAVKTDPTCNGASANTDGTITVTASGGNGSYTYSKDGVTFGASATFNALASNTYTLKAKDAAGCIATVSPNLTLSVICTPCVPPTITGQPTAATACVGANATFTVTANGSTSGYQWQVNTGSGFTDITGETNTTLTLSSVIAGMNGNKYHCVVKEGTATCPDTSSNVILSVDNITAIATKSNPTCNGATPNTDGTITITTSNGTGPYTYSSDNGGLYVNSNPITGLASNTYIVKAKDANGCIATVSPNVTLSVVCPAAPCVAPTIVSQPVSTAGCVNTTAVFNVVAGGTVSGYQWQAYNIATGWMDIPGATSSTLNIPGLLIAANGSKVHCILHEATANCPDTTNDVILTVDALPTSLSTGSLTVCNTNPGTVSGVTASNGLISWSHNGSGSLSGGTTLTPIYTPGGSDVGNTVVLTMTVTSNNSCNPATSQANYSIKVDPVPTALAGGSLTICSNGTATVGGTSASNGTILWTSNGAGSLTNQTTPTPTYTANALDEGKAIILTMTVTSTTSCPNPTPATFTVNVDPLPTATAGGSMTICSNSTATVSGATSSNGSILWTHNGSGSLSNATTLTPTYTPTSADENKTVVLTLTVTSSNTCSSSPVATATYNVSVTPILTATATAGGNTTICMTKSATVIGANATNGTILWTHNGGGILTNATTLTPTYSSIKADTLSPVLLTLTVTPSGGCSNLTQSDTYTINVKSNPQVNPSASTPCVGNNLQLNANTVVGGQYAWTGPNGYANTNQTATKTSVTLLDAGQYTLQITDSNNCINTNTVNVTVNPNPTITTDTLLCVGNQATFSSNTAPATNPWISQSTNLLTIDSSTGVATGILGGTATVGYTDINSCKATKTIKVEDLPVVNFTVDSTSICLGNDVVFTDVSAKKNINLLWDFGDGTTSNELIPTHTYLKVDSFTVSLTSISLGGCKTTYTKDKYITPIEIPTINFSFTPDSIQIYLPEIKFKNSSNAKFYTWIFGDYSPVAHEVNPTHKFPDTPGQSYMVTLKGSNSINGICASSQSHQIVSVDPPVFYIPNSFTPNGDEINNTFQPIFTSGFDPQHFDFWVYNRWGVLIFESHNSTIGWDGTYQNQIVGNDTYVWKLQFKSKQTEREYYYTGNVNLLK